MLERQAESIEYDKEPPLRFLFLFAFLYLKHSMIVWIVIVPIFWYSVGRPVYQKVMITQNEQEIFIGDTAVSILIANYLFYFFL